MTQSDAFDSATARHAAIWFDGRRAVRRSATAWLDDQGHLCVDVETDGTAGALRLRHPPARVRASERWGDSPWPLVMPDGSTVWLNDPAPAIERALHEASDARWARWARASWLHMTAVALMLVAFVVWLDRQGIGWAAQTALFAVPKSLDKHVGAVVMGRIDGRYLRLSSIDDERQMALRERFEQAVARQTPGTQVRLIFRASKEGSSFNAFAAPDGTICMLDDLTQALSDDEVMAVLGHELGHIVHRHGMRRVMESVGLVAAAGVVFGDASSVAGTLASTVQFLRYSRGAEREADDHMRRFVAAEKLPPEVILGVWGKFKKHTESRGAPGLPGWLASHPGLDERIQIQQSRMQTVRE